MSAHVVYDAVLGSGNALKQVESSQFSGGAQAIAGIASGAPNPSDYFIGDASPMAGFITTDVAGAMAFISASAGLHVSAGTITIPWNQRANGGTFTSGSAHARINGTHALIVPVSVSASQGENVRLAIDVHFYSSDGTTAPVTISVNQALASQSFNVLHAFGPVYFGGSLVAECVGWSVNFGISVEKSSHDGSIYPQRVYITDRRPTIDFVFEDFDSVNTFGVMYGVMTSAAVYGRKRSAGGVFVADGTAEHLKFSFADGVTTTEQLSADGTNRGRGALRLHGEALTASVVSAIP